MTFDHDSNCVIPEENLRKAEWATAMIGATLFIIFSKGNCMHIFDHMAIDNLNNNLEVPIITLLANQLLNEIKKWSQSETQVYFVTLWGRIFRTCSIIE